jgi:hypothetical protein
MCGDYSRANFYSAETLSIEQLALVLMLAAPTVTLLRAQFPPNCRICLDTDNLDSFDIETRHTRRATNSRNNSSGDASAWQSLALIATLSLLVRILFLGKSLWLDEGIAVANAWAGGLPLTFWHEWFRKLWAHSEFNMVFYFAVLRVWLRAGNSEAFIRLLSVIPAVATLPVVYAIGRRTFDRRTGLIAALLLAVHGAHVTYSQEARGYTMVVFFCAAATYFFLRAIEDGGWKFWGLYWLSATLGIYSHLFAVLVVAAHWLSLAWALRRNFPWIRLVVTSLAIFVAASPEFYFAVSNQGHQVEWIPKLGVSQVVNTISELAGSPLTLPFYLAMWVVAVAYCRRVWRGEDARKRWYLALLLSWAVAPLVMVIVISVKRPMLVPRYLLISAPAVVLLAAVGAFTMRERRRRIVLWALVFLSLAFIGFLYTRPKEDWRGASAYVLSHAQPGDAVAVVPKWSEPLFAYYQERSGNRTVVEIPALALSSNQSFLNAASQYRRIWVIVYSRQYALHQPDTEMVLGSMADGYREVAANDFRLLHVKLFVPDGTTPETK